MYLDWLIIQIVEIKVFSQSFVARVQKSSQLLVVPGILENGFDERYLNSIMLLMDAYCTVEAEEDSKVQ